MQIDKGSEKVLRVAFVHDWLVTWRGGEKVLEALTTLYPDAPIYTLFYDSSKVPESFKRKMIIAHPLANRLKPFRKALLPILPVWMESFSLEKYDLIISTSSCVAKGAMVGPHTKHVCYIHSPMRYVWDQRDEYLGRVRRMPFFGTLIEIGCSILRLWDITSAVRVNQFIANSRFVKLRVKKYYGHDAVVVHPPIDTERFRPSDGTIKQDYFLAAGAFVNYKRFDLAINACERLGIKLVVAGAGPELSKLKSLAGKNTTIVVAPDSDKWVDLLQGAKGFIFPGVEDFGMVAVEAMAAGTPVIALKEGGALDFVIDGTTGLFFAEANVDSLVEALKKFDDFKWSVEALMRHAEAFSYDNFMKNIRRHIEDVLSM
ncbi:MAG: glycosyltransferase [Proteobacteria bacterium]|nr:glycosyltransferase [Pseudomonadota bacterium]